MNFKLQDTKELFTFEDLLKHGLKKHNAFPEVIIFKKKNYLAFRSAPYHQPNNQAEIVIFSCTQQDKWQMEKRFSIANRDVRDPKYIVYKHSLHLYFGLVRNHKYRKQPIGTLHTSLLKNRKWSKLEPVYERGFLPSRVHILNNQLYMCAYLWNTRSPFISKAVILTSLDGKNWKEKTDFGKLASEGTESDCFLMENGTLLWLIRQDLPTVEKPGSLLLIINPGGKVVKRKSFPQKFDAPLFFHNQKNVWLLARSQKMFEGKYDLNFFWLPKKIRVAFYYLVYWLTAKTTSIWKLDYQKLSLVKQLDLPSQGDTGYCSIDSQPTGSFDIYNYSSPIQYKPLSWKRAQGLPTSIYRHRLKLV